MAKTPIRPCAAKNQDYVSIVIHACVYFTTEIAKDSKDYGEGIGTEVSELRGEKKLDWRDRAEPWRVRYATAISDMLAAMDLRTPVVLAQLGGWSPGDVAVGRLEKMPQ